MRQTNLGKRGNRSEAAGIAFQQGWAVMSSSQVLSIDFQKERDIYRITRLLRSLSEVQVRHFADDLEASADILIGAGDGKPEVTGQSLCSEWR